MKFLLLFLLSLNAYAQGFVVDKIKGKVTYNKSRLKKGQQLSKGGMIKTSANSYVKIKTKATGALLTFAPNSSARLVINKKKQERTILNSGLVRWISQNDNGKGQKVIKTQNAIFGVRGTDFFVSVNSLLGESEIIVFDGKVNFVNSADKDDAKTIGKNQWGGIGGRFGSEIGKVLSLPPKIIKSFDTQTKF
jgi:hypothetical protein